MSNKVRGHQANSGAYLEAELIPLPLYAPKPIQRGFHAINQHRSAKNAKLKDKPYRLFDGGGLYLEIMKNGSKYWRLKYRFSGKENRYAIGVYPEVSLKEARTKREEVKKLLDDGIVSISVQNFLSHGDPTWLLPPLGQTD